MNVIEYHGAGGDPQPPEAETVGPDGATDTAPTLIKPSGNISMLSNAESAVAQLLIGADTADKRPIHLRCSPALTWETRTMGFVSCFAIGTALSLSSVFSFPLLLAGDPTPFAWKYSVGNVVLLASSTFLVGPQQQWEQMASPVRIGASLAYVVSIIVTVFAALVLEFALLTVVAMVIQFCALAWYCASYIPFGRDLIRRCVGRYCCTI